MFGRAWPFRAPVRDGIVPTWPQLLNSVYVPCISSDDNTILGLFSLPPSSLVMISYGLIWLNLMFNSLKRLEESI